MRSSKKKQSVADAHQATWERQQAELWDRFFQVTQDVITVAEALEEGVGSEVIRQELTKTAMRVGAEIVQANAADAARDFHAHIKQAKMKAIETDYWLRMAYVLQQREDLQQDLSGVISQYTQIVNLIEKMRQHTQKEPDVIAKHGRGVQIVTS